MFLEAAEKYFNESLVAYNEALGMDHPQTINALKVFSKWLGLAGKRKVIGHLLGYSCVTFGPTKAAGKDRGPHSQQ